MDIREKIARAIAKARHPLCDPDDRVCPFKTPDIGNNLTLLPPEKHIHPLWTRYLHEAEFMIAAVRQELEAAGMLNADLEGILSADTRTTR